MPATALQADRQTATQEPEPAPRAPRRSRAPKEPAAAPDPETAPEAASAKRHSVLRDLGYGSLVSLSFFRRNAWLLIAIIVSLVALIGLRYQTKTKMSQIRSLERELVTAESEKLQQKSEYMSLIRETEMQRLVDEHHLGLTFQEQPPYRLTPEQ